MAVDPITSTLRARRTCTNFEDSSLKRPKQCICNYLPFPIVDFHKNILTCASQNMDEEMSKLVALKIVQTHTQLMKRQS